jgi:hypothetical protein
MERYVLARIALFVNLLASIFLFLALQVESSPVADQLRKEPLLRGVNRKPSAVHLTGVTPPVRFAETENGVALCKGEILFLAWTASGSTVIGGRGFPCPQKAQSAAVVKSEYPSLIPWG